MLATSLAVNIRLYVSCIPKPLTGGETEFSLKHNTPVKYVKNYSFQFNFGPPWGNCSVTMTAVLGHLSSVEFGPEYKDWSYPPPERLFTGNIHTSIPQVSSYGVLATLIHCS